MAENPFITAHKAYWQPNPIEKVALLQKFPGTITWTEAMRLHHLNCMDLIFETDEGQELKKGERKTSTSATNGAAYQLTIDLLQHLLTEESPYRPRPCQIWQMGNHENPPIRRPSDQVGMTNNASSTHLGALEVMRVSDQNEIKGVDFIPFDDLWMIIFAPPSIYRGARLFYDDGRPDEIVAVPLLYGLSWQSESAYDQDGTITRFSYQVAAESLERRIGIGIGHQDWEIRDNTKAILFGLGSLSQVVTTLDLRDPKFDGRAHARGLDPGEIRRRYAKN